MAEWSELSKDLLVLIVQLLDCPYDVLRLRSVCSGWRSSVQLQSSFLRARFPVLPISDMLNASRWGLHMSTRVIYHIGIPPGEGGLVSDRRNWIVKVEEDNKGRTHLLNPLSGARFKPLPPGLKHLDMSKFRVSELGKEYILSYVCLKSGLLSHDCVGDSPHVEQVAFRPEGNPKNGITEFTLLRSEPGLGLAMFKPGAKEWTLIKGTECHSPFYDVKLYKGEFCTAGKNGVAVVIDTDSVSTIGYVPNLFPWCRKRHLVESCGDLSMVDVGLHMSEYGQTLREEDHYDRENAFITVYKLFEQENKWVKITSLGDQILFLGRGSNFSVSCSNLPGMMGNCIYIITHSSYQDGALEPHDVGVYHMETRMIKPLTALSSEWKLFWPPPSWVA